MTAPEQIWIVEAEESASRDELGQLFADYDKADLTALAKCYEAEPTEYTRTDIHQAALDRIAELEGELGEAYDALDEAMIFDKGDG